MSPFGGFSRAKGEEGEAMPAPPDPETAWIRVLEDGSFLFEPQGGLWPGRRFRGYDVVIRDGRLKRVPAGTDGAELRIFVTEQGVRSQHAFDYPAAHLLTSIELETQIHEAEPFQPGLPS